MQIKWAAGQAIVVVVALAGGVGIGMVGVNFAHAGTPSRPGPAKPFAVNANGQTYGSDAQSTSLATEPDLILAQGTNGKIGYVRKSDLFGVMPRTPQAAVAGENPNGVQPVRAIPLYASDGTTVIGTFIVGGGHVQLIQSHQSSDPSNP